MVGERINPFSESRGQRLDPADEELVAEAQVGNKDALEQLVRRHQPWVFNIAIRMLWHREQAEDATQEILIKVVTKLSTFRVRANSGHGSTESRSITSSMCARPISKR